MSETSLSSIPGLVDFAALAKSRTRCSMSPPFCFSERSVLVLMCSNNLSIRPRFAASASSAARATGPAGRPLFATASNWSFVSEERFVFWYASTSSLRCPKALSPATTPFAPGIHRNAGLLSKFAKPIAPAFTGRVPKYAAGPTTAPFAAPSAMFFTPVAMPSAALAPAIPIFCATINPPTINPSTTIICPKTPKSSTNEDSEDPAYALALPSDATPVSPTT